MSDGACVLLCPDLRPHRLSPFVSSSDPCQRFAVSHQRVKWMSPPAISAADLVCLIDGVETRREASVVVSELKERLLASNAVVYCTIKVRVRRLAFPSILTHTGRPTDS